MSVLGKITTKDFLMLDALQDRLHAICKESQSYSEAAEKAQKEYYQLKCSISEQNLKRLVSLYDALTDIEIATAYICYKQGIKDAIKTMK